VRIWLLILATTALGQEWTKEPGVRVGTGNVPFVYPAEGGGYRLYFCGQGGIVSALSSDGLEFRMEAGVRVMRGCDPSLVKLDDGRFRMYYKIPTGPGGPGQSVHKAYSAVSADGVNFVDEGLRLESEGTIDRGWVSVPEVVRTFDGKWRMYDVSARDGIVNMVVSAMSEDGLRFEREEGVRLHGIVDPAIVQLDNGQYWMFGMVGIGSAPGTPLRMRSATSADGLEFVWDEGDILRSGGADDRNGVFDPTVVALGEGRYRMYYGGDTMKTLSAVGRRVDNPAVGAGAALNAADGRRRELAPGAIATFYGERVDGEGGEVEVAVNGRAAKVHYSSAGQVNFMVPEGLTGRAAHVVVAARNGRKTTALAELRRVSPALFTRDGERGDGGTGCGELFDGAVPSGGRRALRGTFLDGTAGGRAGETQAGGRGVGSFICG
jgi:hypothetical protein